MANPQRLSIAAVLLALSTTFGGNALAADEKRPRQDYGAPPEATDVGDIVVWPLRIVLFPLWLVTELVLRQPTGALVRGAEEGRWIQTAEDIFTFGHKGAPLGQFSIFPSALFDFGIKPSVGFNADWKYIGAPENSVRLHFGTWGPDWVSLRASDTYEISKDESVFVEGSLVRRRDNLFFGVGPFSRQDDRTRYNSMVTEVDIGHRRNFWRSSAIQTRAGLRTLLFGDSGCCDDPTLADEVAAGRIDAPGFGRGYRAVFQRVDLEVDSRRPRPAPGSGIRAEVHEESVFTVDPLAGEERRSWVKYGGSVGAAVDVTGEQRVLSLAVAAELADPLAGSIPFPDLASLGGDSLMPGFLRGRLVDRSSAVAHLQYRWPVWVFLDGVLHAAVGNVFGEHLSGFDVKSTRLSTGVGFRSNGDRSTGFELLFAVGSEPFDDRFQIDSFRLVIGTHHGF